VGQSITLVDGHGVGDTVPGVHNNTSGTTRGVQGQHSLDSHVHGWGVEGLKHDLEGRGESGSLREQHGVLLGSHAQLVVEGVVPDLLHVIPVGDDAVLNGVLQGEDAPLALGLIPHVAVLLPHAHHDALMPGTPHNGRKHSTGGIIPREACLAH
ncbi:hypothetical protein AS27_15214, partial [Aptenodytes forsteri]